uniref:Uncharacterized protein n=1 Tax=Steinernema glaseri TaxID=37863 RepID=A0A1I8AI46_9BILA
MHKACRRPYPKIQCGFRLRCERTNRFGLWTPRTTLGRKTQGILLCEGKSYGFSEEGQSQDMKQRQTDFRNQTVKGKSRKERQKGNMWSSFIKSKALSNNYKALKISARPSATFSAPAAPYRVGITSKPKPNTFSLYFLQDLFHYLQYLLQILKHIVSGPTATIAPSCAATSLST